MLKVAWMDFYHKYLLDLWTQYSDWFFYAFTGLCAIVILLILVITFFSKVSKYGFWKSVYCYFLILLICIVVTTLFTILFFEPDIYKLVKERSFTILTGSILVSLFSMDDMFEYRNIPFTKEYQERRVEESRRHQLEMN